MYATPRKQDLLVATEYSSADSIIQLQCIKSTEVQNPRRNSYTQTMDVCITPCTVDISVDSPSLQLYLG